MPKIHLVTGAAGTGKTHRLLELALAWGEKVGLGERQRVLFITRLHGSRRRLIERIETKCPQLRRKVATVDSFALQLVNRWRGAFGLQRSVHIDENPGDFRLDCIGVRAGFAAVLARAAQLLRGGSVGSLVGAAFPLTVIDEFQDCTGEQLTFVKALAEHTWLYLAGDGFQELNGDEQALAWAEALAREGMATVERLTSCWRCGREEILEAAGALREGRQLAGPSKLVVAKPTFSLAVWETVGCKGCRGQVALITLAERILRTYVTHLQKQRAKKGWGPLTWPLHEKDSQVKAEIVRRLRGQRGQRDSAQARRLWPSAKQHLDQISRRCGIDPNDQRLLDFCASAAIHQAKLLGRSTGRRVALTTAGAKNQEFDHVHVIWQDQVLGAYSEEQQRRHLYNAITRAKVSCKVIVVGSPKMVNDHPVLSLLGRA